MKEISSKNRKSNIELLRILIMVLIVSHHFAHHSGFSFPSTGITINRLWIQFIDGGGKIGVNIFAIISGYFMISNSDINKKKIIRIWFQLFFYSIGIYSTLCILGIINFTFGGIIKHLFPITFSNWWFASCYIVLCLIAPLLNTTLRSITKKQYQSFIIILFVIWSVIPTFLGYSWESNNLLWLLFMYIIGAYIKLYPPNYNLNRLRLGLFICIATTFLTVIFFDLLGMKYAYFSERATYFYDMQRIPIVLISILLFLSFEKMELGQVNSINIISSTTFAVYLLSDEPLMRTFFWERLFNGAIYQNSLYLIPYSIFAILSVFTICSVIDLLRVNCLGRFEELITGIVTDITEYLIQYGVKAITLINQWLE